MEKLINGYVGECIYLNHEGIQLIQIIAMVGYHGAHNSLRLSFKNSEGKEIAQIYKYDHKMGYDLKQLEKYFNACMWDFGTYYLKLKLSN